MKIKVIGIIFVNVNIKQVDKAYTSCRLDLQGRVSSFWRDVSQQTNYGSILIIWKKYLFVVFWNCNMTDYMVPWFI